MIKKLIAITLAAVMLAATGVILTGCGNDDKTKKLSETSSAAKAVDTVETTQAPETEDTKSDDGDGYMDESEAVAKIKEQAGSGAAIKEHYKGTDPDGKKAWVFVVVPITKDDTKTAVTYYVNDDFCYCIEDNEKSDDSDDSDDADDSDGSDDSAEGDSDRYISEAQALKKVREMAGSGAQIKNSKKGTTPDGKKAWVITVIPITKDDGPATVVYYINDSFCYSE
ncbi:MAG: hypothetical protein K6F88_03755 [Ruminococcus sp.]|nr:hypothetical protein [Ruminococcus sp.]